MRRVCKRAGIRVCFKSNGTLQSVLVKVKPRFSPGDTKSVIYRILCQDYDKSYTGETGRTMAVRLTEHRRYCPNGETSRSQHTLQDDHRIDWEKNAAIAREPNYYKKGVKEALFIKKFHNMNHDQGLALIPNLEHCYIMHDFFS